MDFNFGETIWTSASQAIVARASLQLELVGAIPCDVLIEAVVARASFESSDGIVNYTVNGEG